MTETDKKPQFNLTAKKPGPWSDRSMIVYAMASDSTEAEANVVITQEMMAEMENFKKYVARQKKVMKEQIPQYDHLSERDGELNGFPAHDISCRWMSPAGPVQQRIVFMSIGKGHVVTFAATAPVDDFDNHVKKFNSVLTSVKVEEV